MIDNYCERIGPGLLGEPLNAAANAAFFVAAWAAWRLARRRETRWDVNVLLILLLAIGSGSTLFHTVAEAWAMWADVIPILLFQLVYVPSYGIRVIGLRAGAAAFLLAGFVALVIGFGSLPMRWLNGSLGYAPALITLGGLGLWHWRARRAARGLPLLATALFAVSLCFRSLDMAVCAQFPLGLHFLWHLLNGLVLYLAMAALLANLPLRQQSDTAGRN